MRKRREKRETRKGVKREKEGGIVKDMEQVSVSETD